MTLNIVPIEDVRTGKGAGRNGGIRYAKYSEAIKPFLPELKAEIEKSGTIRLLSKDFAKQMGKEYEVLNPTSFHWGLKYSLFKAGIVLDIGTYKKGGKVLIMRARTDKDELPDSLAKVKSKESGVVKTESAEGASVADRAEGDEDIGLTVDELIGETGEVDE